MPGIYAHNSFGHRVCQKLPEELQQIVNTHQKEFEAGLQGPDFLFFYHPMFKLRTNQLGYWQHGQPLHKYLKRLLPGIRREGMDSGLYAYILGFICHFMLDSECHSYVIPLSEHPGYNHLAIENEFERFLICRDGHKPLTFPVWEKIPLGKEVVETIYKAYRFLGVTKRQIRRSIRGIHFYKKLLGCGCTLKRALVRFAMLITAHYRQLEGHMMALFPKRYASKTNQALQHLYDNAVTMTSELLVDFHQSVWEGKPLHERFSTTFKSSQTEPVR